MFEGLIFRLIATWEACISGELPPLEATQNEISEYYADIPNQYLLPTYKTDCTCKYTKIDQMYMWLSA